MTPNPVAQAAVVQILAFAQLEALRRLIEPELEKTMGQGQPAKEYMRLLEEICERQILGVGDKNPALAALLSSELDKIRIRLSGQP